MFWQPNDPHNGGLETKPIAPTASAAHIYGKARVAAEAFTSIPNPWDDHPFALKNFADRHFALGVTHLVFHTYRFDYLNPDVLLNRLSVRDGRLLVPEGTSWRGIWLPREQCSRLTPATLGKLKELLEAGATIIGEPPLANPSLSGGAAADRQFASLVNGRLARAACFGAANWRPVWQSSASGRM